jgi:hypothetical protein
MSLQNWKKMGVPRQKKSFKSNPHLEVQNILHEGNIGTKMRCNSLA